MASVNKVILIGNLTRDPELRYTPKNTAVTELGIATNRRYRVENEMREETTFVDVTVWGVQAENASKYLSKGRAVYVEGRLQLDSWEDKTSGQKRNKLKVVAETVQFLGGRGDGGGARPQQSQTAPGPMTSAPDDSRGNSFGGDASPGNAPTFDDEEDDDIPF